MEEASFAPAFAAREPWAFDEAYRRYGSLLFSVALNVLHSAQDAEDCVHDVLVRIWKRRDAFALDRGSVRAFLVVCVRNDAVSRRRAAARRDTLGRQAAAQTPLSEEFEIADFVEQARVQEALATIPHDQRIVVALAYFGGKTHVEIARLLDEPLGTVKSRISLGLRKLAQALSAERQS